MSTTTQSTSTAQTEAWMRGPIEGIEPMLMPVAHALVQAREELERIVSIVPDEHVWLHPGGAAPIGFHVRHLGAALDRLFTYARGERLSDAQKAAFRTEGEPGDPPATVADLVNEATAHIDRALNQLRHTSRDQLLEFRGVGRAQLPSNVLGLLFHAAEHSTRHSGQLITTAKILAAR
jgi:DinB family protein